MTEKARKPAKTLGAHLVYALRGEYAMGLSIAQLTQKYNLPRSTVYDAVTGRTWGHL